MAAQIRAECNTLTLAERETLLERAMQLAYGALNVSPKDCADAACCRKRRFTILSF